MRDAVFTDVYRTHVDFVWRLSRSLGVDPLDADDLVHEVFLVVRARLPARDPEAPIRAWLARITRNLALHHHRSRARDARRLARVDPPPTPRGPDEELDLGEAAALMHAFLQTLDAARREVFALVEIEGLSAPEVAEACGAKLPTIYTRLRAARAAFAEFVARLRPADGVRPSDGGRHVRR